MKNKNLILNTVMVIAAISIVLGGVFFVRQLKDGGTAQEESFAIVTKASGSVKIQRKGIGYTLEPQTRIVAQDVISTLPKAQAVLSLRDDASITLDENTRLSAVQNEADKAFILEEGSVYAEYRANTPLSLRYSGGEIRTEDGAFSLQLYQDVPNLYVMDGSVHVTYKEDAQVLELAKGERLFISADGSPEGGSFQPQSLSSFDLGCASRSTRKGLEEEKASFEAVLAQREEYTRQAILKKLNETPRSDHAQKTEEAPQPPAAQPDVQQPPAEPNRQPASIEIEQRESAALALPEGEQGSVDDHHADTSSKRSMTATVSIDCSTILDNMDQLKPEKGGYVPADGMILYPIEVEFSEGETAFDVLRRVCDSAGIQLEYSWNGVFGSNYIEGIQQLYEFDCGEGSGWMYHVNGWYPDRGISAYQLNDGDYIEFRYTCSFGEDLGARV